MPSDMETKKINIALIEHNNGQIPGLPRNPRLWSEKELDKLKNSLTETPELLEARPPLVVSHNGTFVCIGGNMRLEAMREMGMTEIPVVVLASELSKRKLKEIAVKDNSQFGSWDMDALANEWSDYPLADYGLLIYDAPEESHDSDATPIDDKEKVEIELTPDEYSFVAENLRRLAPTPEEAVLKILGL